MYKHFQIMRAKHIQFIVLTIEHLLWFMYKFRVKGN